MPRITGAQQHLELMRRLRGAGAKDAAYRGLFAAAGMIEAEARNSITAKSISGKGHVPSKPGDPPNADTHQLDTGIFTEGDKTALSVKVISSAPHGLALEFGTSEAGKDHSVTIAERPYMRPASMKEGPNAVQFVARYLSQMFRRR